MSNDVSPVFHVVRILRDEISPRRNTWQKVTICLVLSAMAVASHAAERSVKTLEINASGRFDHARNDAGEEEACRKFRPTRKQVIRFLNRARPVDDEGRLLHERYSSCYAEGTVVFADGISGEWVLRSSGVALLFINKVGTMLFYKNNQWKDPWECSYGMSSEEEC